MRVIKLVLPEAFEMFPIDISNHPAETSCPELLVNLMMSAGQNGRKEFEDSIYIQIQEEVVHERKEYFQ